MKSNRSMRPYLAVVLLSSLLVSVVGTATAAGTTKHSRRWELVHQLVLKWAPHVKESYGVDPRAWGKQMAPLLGEVRLDTLQRAVDARSFDAMNKTLLGSSLTDGAGGGVTIESLGDVATDLVYVPVAPCRLFDTRIAGGAIAAGNTRNFDVTAVADYGFQGGDASDCGVGASGSFAAAAINLSIVGPSAQGFVTAFPYLTTRPLAATMAYKAGALDSSLAIVRLDQGASASEMSVYSSASTHVVGDIVGYFTNPVATALDCTDSADDTELVGVGGTGTAVAPACPTGYTETGTNCTSSSWLMPIVFSRNGVCSARNNGGASADLIASRTCCRVPGR